jgi:hypothetical protein
VASTRATFGFLYVDYGSSAWWWEVEELLRKLLLSAVVVLIDEGSPLQVTLGVLVSGWAHVLHAQYKPWGDGSVLYSLQHGALFVTSFVFLMGLLFKVDGVSSSSGTYTALSGIMVTLCVAFMAAWVIVILVRVALMWRDVRSSRKRRRWSQCGVMAGSKTEHGGVDDAWLPDSVTRGVVEDAVGVGGVEGTREDGTTAVVPVEDVSTARSTPAFVVDNPLRRPTRHDDGHGVSARDDAASANVGASTAADVRIERPAARGGTVVTQGHGQQPTMTPRLQRVLAAQRPVQSARLAESSKQDTGV